MAELTEPETATEEHARVEAQATKTLETTAMRATFWTVMEYGCSMALRVVNSMVLTRLLMPESFGLMALVMTMIVGMNHFTVIAEDEKKTLDFYVGLLGLSVGHRPDLSFCRELHVFEPTDQAGIRQPEPNYFVLGAKSRGREANFLLRQGFADIRDVFAEAKGNGFDVKALRTIVRLRKQDANERAEQETILETYMQALGML